MVASRSDFRHLSIMTSKTVSGEMYQLRMSVRLNRKTIGLGSDRIQALNLALMVDEEISRLEALSAPIDIDRLKEMVKQALKANKAKKTGLKLVEKEDLTVLWDNYKRFNVGLNNWTENYIGTHIRQVTRHVNECPYQKLEDKIEVFNWLCSTGNRSKKTNKELFKLIVAAIDWNSKQGKISRIWGIEYRDLLESIKVKEEKKSEEDEDIKIFSVAEIYRILKALKDDTYSRYDGKHRQYYAYAYFCWLTGCRPSEATALKWENVDFIKKRIKFCEVEMVRGGKRISRKGTKTEAYRYFSLNNELLELLGSMSKRNGYVFTTTEGKPINQDSFSVVWKKLLLAMDIEHRVPYQLRHTMISYHANNDYPIHKLAELVGNSEKIIKEHYLKLDIERINLPDVIKF